MTRTQRAIRNAAALFLFGVACYSVGVVGGYDSGTRECVKEAK